mgnify:CR=1 FL=1
MTPIYFIDNQDSFTYNLVEELKSLGFMVSVYRNHVEPETMLNKIQRDQAEGKSPILFLSPGPGTPAKAGNLMAIIEACHGQLPIIGVCLGHQAIGQYYGAKVGLAGETVHGKSSTISLEQHPIFSSFGNALEVARYHSLVITQVPNQLQTLAKYRDLVMAVIDESNKVLGFQFHPESILTTQGSALLKASLDYLTEQGS